MEKKVILIDSDGVICDLASHWCDLYNKKYGDNLTVEEFAGSWDGMAQAVKPECGEAVYDFLKEPGMFQGCKPYPGAVEAMQQFVDHPGYDAFIVSAFSGSSEAAKGKMEFLEEHLPFFDPENMILCKPKYLVSGHVLIDDSFKNLKRWSEAMKHNTIVSDPLTIMIAQPHNEEEREKDEVVVCVSSLAEAYKFVSHLS